MATDQEKQAFLDKYGLHTNDDGSFHSATLDIDIPKPDPRVDKFAYIQGRINSIERAKATFDANAPKPGIIDQIKTLGGKAFDAAQPYLPTMSDVPAIAGAAAGGAAFGPPGAVLGGLGGEGIKQIFGQLSNGPTPPVEAAGDYAKAAIPSAVEGMGAQLMAKLGLTKAMQGAAGGATKWIEQRLLGGGQAAEKRALAAQLAPEMAQDPAFTRALSRRQFDEGIVSRMSTAKDLLNNAAAAVPPGTTADKAAILTDIEKLKDQFHIEGKPGQYTSVNKDALNAIDELKAEIDKQEDRIPWEKLREFRQKLDKNVFLKGGFKETSTAADRASVMADRGVANVARQHLADSLPPGLIRDNMAAANAAYSKASDMGLASGMDFGLGRRLSDIGSPSFIQKWGPRALMVGTAEELLRHGARDMINSK